MSPRAPKDLAASVRQRLLNRARAENRPFQEVLQYYAMERFLYRLSLSECVDNYFLKGALMLRAWRSPEFRPTMDIDVLGRTQNDAEHVVEQIRNILATPVEPDGLTFDDAEVQAERITEDADYEGIRIRFAGALGTAKVHMQIDVGFGDVVYPQPEEVELPTVLDFPPPRLLGYSKESVIAEKFEAMLQLGELNSRMKDFYDIWLLSRLFDFDGARLAEAIRRTLERRKTPLPEDIVAFSPAFAAEKQAQWSAFHKRLSDSSAPPDFTQVVQAIDGFLSPVATALHAGRRIRSRWSAPGPWN